jgi:hypothetical protein
VHALFISPVPPLQNETVFLRLNFIVHVLTDDAIQSLSIVMGALWKGVLLHSAVSGLVVPLAEIVLGSPHDIAVLVAMLFACHPVLCSYGRSVASSWQAFRSTPRELMGPRAAGASLALFWALPRRVLFLCGVDHPRDSAAKLDPSFCSFLCTHKRYMWKA